MIFLKTIKYIISICIPFYLSYQKRNDYVIIGLVFDQIRIHLVFIWISFFRNIKRRKIKSLTKKCQIYFEIKTPIEYFNFVVFLFLRDILDNGLNVFIKK